MTKIMSLKMLDPLKVFVEYDTQYETFVAQCLQTGHLVTADTAEMTREMIVELLTDEITMAVASGNLSSLLSNPAPMAVWLKWELAARTGLDKDSIKVPGAFPQQLMLLVGHAEVLTEIQIATGTTGKKAA